MDEQLAMPKNVLLAKIYYELGKQTTNFYLQASTRNDKGEHWFTKRRTFLDLDPDVDTYFLQTCNHRGVLGNEIIIDIDRAIPRETALDDPEVRHVIQLLKRDKWRFCVYASGKGVHVHLYNDILATYSRQKRVYFREDLLKYLGITDTDPQLKSDTVGIALEFTPHWKTGAVKILLLNHGVDVWM